MWINNTEDIKRFEDTINHCRKSVIIVSMTGAEYDMKKPEDFMKGLSCMINAAEYNEPEVYANCPDDEDLLFRYLNNKAS